MPTSPNSQKARKNKNSVAKRWKAARSKPSEATAIVKGKNSDRSQRAAAIVALLKRYYPEAKCSLDSRNELELLVATMLSAQCTDARVNKVTPELFRRYPDAKAYSQAKLTELEELVRSTGFYRNKAKNIQAMGLALVQKHGGQVPNDMDSLSQLPGVGRKTANVVLGNAFGIPGMVVDTHVTRLSNRLGLAKGTNAVVLEKQLEAVINKSDWVIFSHLLIEHGRKVCVARKPRCEVCFLSELCPHIGVV